MRRSPPAENQDYGSNVSPPPRDDTGGGGGAPVDAEYVVMSLNGTLTNERRLQATTPIVVTDGGANGDVTLTHATSGVSAASYGSATQVGTFTVDAKGHLTAASNVTITGFASTIFAWVWGDGADGAAVFDGSNAVTGASRSGTTYTLTRSVAYTSCQIDNGVTVLFNNAGGIWCTGTFTNNGTLSANGNNASGASGGVAISAGFWAAGAAGGAGSGGPGGAVTNALGGAGGAGGTNTGGTGGLPAGGGTAGGGVTTPTTVEGSLAFTTMLQAMLSGRSTGATRYAGGGGGSGGSLNMGAGGGATCGLVAARLIAGSGLYTANGGTGTSAGVGSNAGGGGGGGGGALFMVTTTANPASVWTFQVNGGAGGAAWTGGVGRNGVDGSAGRTIISVLA